MNKPTPGPWTAVGMQQLDLGENFYINGGPDGACYIAEMLNADHFPCIEDDEVEDYEMMVKANARLIIAACNAAQAVNPANPIAAAEAMPQVLMALRMLYAAFPDCDGGNGGTACQIARAAIAAATKGRE